MSQLSQLAHQRVPLVKRCFPLGSIPCQRANSRRRWSVLSPMSPRSGDPSFGGHCCPGVSKLIPADGDSSSSRSGSTLPSLLSKLTHTFGGISGLGERRMQYCTVLTGVTVTCAASRLRLSTYRLMAASSSSGRNPLSPSINSIVFCQGLSLAGIEIASFNAFTSDHKLAVNYSGVGGSERGP